MILAWLSQAHYPHYLSTDHGCVLRRWQVEWDPRPDFTSGENGESEGSEIIDATGTLCTSCVESFSLGNLTLAINGTANFFGRLNAGNRILVRKGQGFLLQGAE